ncbi:MAG: HAMP domain-containing histidine kinase [Gemmatimonadaceae bacterium]|nr:HAMP domain-containing histidine kinase [Gemmatimonadaceae bacterium]
MSISEFPLQSAVRAEDWANVHDELLHGLVHTANNRIAALGGIVQLQENDLMEADEALTQLRDEVARLRALMLKFRAMTVRRAPSREPVRLGDVLQGTVDVLAHHAVARNWTITLTEEAGDVPPVNLWAADHLRFGVLLLLAAGAGTAKGEYFVTFAAPAASAEVTVTAQNSAEVISASAEFEALSRAATSEGGALRCERVSDTHADLVLSLPGLA